MTELELFYFKAISSVREMETEYLTKVKRVPIAQELPEIEEATSEAYAEMKFIQRLLYRWNLRKQIKARRKAERAQRRTVEDDLTKGYCAGVEEAIRIITKEFSAYVKAKAREE